MKSLNNTIAKCFLGLFLASTAVSASAQTAPATTPSTPTAAFSYGADVVSSYIWRGFTENTTPNVQPTASFTYGGLTLGAWGSESFDGKYKEVDFSVAYAFNNLFSIAITDYDWNTLQTGTLKYGNYFAYKNDSTGHVFEGTISYAGVKAFPLSVSVNTMFYGADKKISSDGTKLENAYSTYVELGYPVAKNAKLSVGGLYTSAKDGLNAYGVTQKGFNITNIALRVNKDIKITDSFTLPVYGIVGFNPEALSSFFVAGVSF